tara:strand:- start:3093 stop:3959 length:867 start_codon:yes stop_codon:yes gene_type:complete
MTAQLLVFGPGYSAQPIIKQAQENGWKVSATYRNDETRQQQINTNINPIAFNGENLPNISAESPLHLLVTIAPKQTGDPTLNIWETCLRQQNNIASINYLSSTNVYGDHQGNWVNETTLPTPNLDRGKFRLQAEQRWQSLTIEKGARLFIYRLAGIYGPDRNAFKALKAGRARCIIKENQIFSRIHVEDIRQTVWCAMNSNHKGGIFNLADNEPSAPHEVIEAAAKIMGCNAPKREQWDTAELSEMARSFYLESKRVCNTKIKQELGVELLFPNYKRGLEALLKTDGY